MQDFLLDNLSKENSIESLASRVGMSPRNLSRVFKEKTGTTVLEYLTTLRIEYAKTNGKAIVKNIKKGELNSRMAAHLKSHFVSPTPNGINIDHP